MLNKVGNYSVVALLFLAAMAAVHFHSKFQASEAISNEKQKMLDENQRQFKYLDEKYKSLAQSQVTAASVKEVLDKIPEVVKKEMEKTKAQAFAAGQISGITQLRRDLDALAKNVYKNEKKPELSQKQYKFPLRVGDKQINAGWVFVYTETGKVKLVSTPLEFNANVYEATQKTGMHARWVDLSVQEKGKPETRIPVIVSKSEWIEKKPDGRSFFWWDPTLEFGGNILVDLDAKISQNIFGGISLSSYGYTVKDSLFRFMSVQVMYGNDQVKYGLAPISYNIGEILPLIEDLWIGPTAAYNPSATTPWCFGFGLSATF